MGYFGIIVVIIFVAFAIFKQKSFKEKMSGFVFYGDEALQIAKTIIPSNEEICFISCGTNIDTQNKAMFSASMRSSITQSRTQDYKYYDYSIVAKTKEKIYFIPVKIVGTLKIELQLNPKMKTKVYDIQRVRQEVIEHKPNKTMATIDVKFSMGSDTSYSVQFYDNFEEFK